MRHMHNRSGNFSVVRLLGLTLLAALVAIWAAHLRGYDIWAPARQADAMVESLWDRVLPWRSAPATPAVEKDGADLGFSLAQVASDIIDANQARAAAERQRQALRQAALAELQELASFMMLCGEINPGFEGCRSDRPFREGDAYEFSIVTGGDGFIITAAARGAQSGDRCSLLVADSNLEVEAFTADGERITAECVASDFLQAQAVIPVRAEDQAAPLPAPSGAKRLHRDLAQTSGAQGDMGLAQN